MDGPPIPWKEEELRSRVERAKAGYARAMTQAALSM
jgi:hypothetical protein